MLIFFNISKKNWSIFNLNDQNCKNYHLTLKTHNYLTSCNLCKRVWTFSSLLHNVITFIWGGSIEFMPKHFASLVPKKGNLMTKEKNKSILWLAVTDDHKHQLAPLFAWIPCLGTVQSCDWSHSNLVYTWHSFVICRAWKMMSDVVWWVGGQRSWSANSLALSNGNISMTTL